MKNQQIQASGMHTYIQLKNSQIEHTIREEGDEIRVWSIPFSGWWDLQWPSGFYGEGNPKTKRKLSGWRKVWNIYRWPNCGTWVFIRLVLDRVGSTGTVRHEFALLLGRAPIVGLILSFWVGLLFVLIQSELTIWFWDGRYEMGPLTTKNLWRHHRFIT